MRTIAGRLGGLRPALRTSGVILIVAAAASWAAAGPLGALGAAAGVALVAASYTATMLAVAWADSVDSQLVFPVGMGLYVVKFSLLGSLLIFTGGTEWPGRIPLVVGIVAGIAGWVAVQIWWVVGKRDREHIDGAGARS